MFGLFKPKGSFTFDAGSPIQDPIAVGAGKAFFGCSDGRILALDARSGRKVWEFCIPSNSGATPVFAEGRVYFWGWDKKLRALDANSGKEIWQQSCDGGLRTQPAPGGEVIFFATAESSSVIALDAGSGEKIWTYTADRGVDCTPVVGYGVVFANTFDPRYNSSTVLGLDAATGKVRWQSDEVGMIDNAICLGDDSVLVLAGSFHDKHNTLVCMDAASGELRWRETFPRVSSVAGPAALDGVAYLCCAEAIAFDLVSGKHKWVCRVPVTQRGQDQFKALSTPVFSGRLLILAGSGGHIVGIGLESGRDEWRYQVPDDVFGCAFDSGRLLFGCADGKFRAVTAKRF
jgi:outer membrane protein assembly factor BamB